MQESWGAITTSQAQEFADQLGIFAAFAAPSLPRPPDPPEGPDQTDIEVGLSLLSRWPIAGVRQVESPARHRTPAPVAMVATLEHPAGAVHTVVACLEWEPACNDDRIAPGTSLVDIAIDPPSTAQRR